jgi:hypothetical protein
MTALGTGVCMSLITEARKGKLTSGRPLVQGRPERYITAEAILSYLSESPGIKYRPRKLDALLTLWPAPRASKTAFVVKASSISRRRHC